MLRIQHRIRREIREIRSTPGAGGLLGAALLAVALALVAPEALAKPGPETRSTPVRNAVPAQPISAKAAAVPIAFAPQPSSSWTAAAGGLAGLALLLTLGAAFVSRRIFRRPAEATPSLAYAVGSETVAAPPPSQPMGSEYPGAQSVMRIPAQFDVCAFLGTARQNFIKVQLAGDRNDLAELRELTSHEMFAHMTGEVHASGALLSERSRLRNVVTLQAALLELASEQGMHLASVRFSGLLQQRPGSEPIGFQEIWNLAKPVNGSSGWLLAGIQQMH